MRYPYRPPFPPKAAPPAPPKAPLQKQTPLPLSPYLTVLLSLVYRDGFTSWGNMDMLRDIQPYLGTQDRQAVTQLLQAQQTVKDLAQAPVVTQAPRPSRSWLTQTERFLGILDVLQRYGGQQSARTFADLRKYLTLRDKLLRLQHSNGASLPDIAALLDGGAPPQMQQALGMMQMLAKGSDPMQLLRTLPGLK